MNRGEKQTVDDMVMPPYLPHELIIEILLRLPVKSLIRFKCVSKYWFSLISDSQFANSQFQLNAETHTHRALFIATESPHETQSIDLEASLDDDSSIVSLNPNFIPSQPSSCIEIEASCRGFILLQFKSSIYIRDPLAEIYSTFYLWNPSTGLHRQIPLSPFIVDAQYFYGFGYDHSTDDYLIVSISSCINSSYLEFFSLRANTWKQIDDDTHIHYGNASHFNGAIHWFAYCHELEKNVIVAFDLMKRKLLEMPFPDQFDLEIAYYKGLWVFKEYLSLCAMNKINDTVEIWVMKEYKVHSSWTKTHVLPTDGIPNNLFFPLCSTKSGDIVGVDYHNRLVKYNDERPLLGHRSYRNNPDVFQMAVYTECLLSLPGDNVGDEMR
ncbi:F-box/kelch-repeat protein [Trifolium repens]|nr:F-box/kelch-repeat protein [Trifolium repens]